MKKKNKLSLAERKENMKKNMTGTGRYKFQNKTKADFLLPKPGLNGEKEVCSGKTFEGDSYFLSYVPTILLIVEVLSSKEDVVKSEVLLTEQPPIYTTEGQVEFVKAEDGELLEEAQDKPAKKNNKKKQLIVDGPLESVQID